eukprot:6205603-Pleurochrysis_carterae.AAC.2
MHNKQSFAPALAAAVTAQDSASGQAPNCAEDYFELSNVHTKPTPARSKRVVQYLATSSHLKPCLRAQTYSLWPSTGSDTARASHNLQGAAFVYIHQPAPSQTRKGTIESSSRKASYAGAI